MKNSPVTEEKLDKALDQTKTDIKGWFQEFKDEVFNRLDDISGQLETIRDEQTIGFHQYKQLEQKVDDNEDRIAILEKPHS